MTADSSFAPLILTLKVDGPSQERFDDLRRAHFPPGRNFIPAHVTLFHHLPGDREREEISDLQEACGHRETFPVPVTGVRSLGKGVAYELDSPDLTALRQELAETWWPFLGKQDRQRFKAHVTVQNKVQPEEARDLHQKLQASFSPFEVTAEGLLLWRYVGGPWEPVGEYPFGRQLRREE